MDVDLIFHALKSKDKKIRYKALDTILKFSRSNKTSWKKEFIESVLLKSSSKDWEDRYVVMYAISRFYRRDWKFEDFKKQFLNVLRLLEDADGRVRIAARNALEHFRTSFLLFIFGQWKTDSKQIVDLWRDSLFLLWEKIDAMGQGKMQLHLVQCIKIIYQHDMDAYLNKKDFERYEKIWNKVIELDDFYYEFGVE